MKKLPYPGICIGCAILAALVAGRCGTTVWRVLYDHTGSVKSAILRDPWLYVGIAAAAIALICGAFWRWEKRRKTAQQNSDCE